MSAPTAVPGLGRPRRARRPATAQRTLDSGLHVVAVRRPGVPMVEVRLRVPFLSAGRTHPPRASLLSDTMLTGAGSYDRSELAATVQSLGADLSVTVDADRLLAGGNVLAINLRPFLTLLATVLTEAGYPKSELAQERDRLIERLVVARSRPGVIASEAIARRLWDGHPYAHDLPQPDAVAEVRARDVRQLHGEFVLPHGASLIVVGDVSPGRALDAVEASLTGWRGEPAHRKVPALPATAPGPTVIVDRPGSVQSSIRFGGVALPRADPDYAALQLANLIFGGYFSSRWTENLREDKGYTYGPHSRIEHQVLGSALLLDADVATEVTAPAMLETRYELGRIATLGVRADEVEAVRQYAIGTLALATSTQAGLASMLAGLAASGLGLDWIAEHPVRLSEVTVEQVNEAARRFFAPAALVEVIVGDAAAITTPLSAIGPLAGDA